MRKLFTAAALAALLTAPALAQDHVYQMKDEGIKTPVLVREVKPQYTEDAMRRKVQGIVEMSGVVRTDGKITDITVTRSLDADLDEQAMAALRQWEFRPGTKDGQAVNVQVQVEMTFTLRAKK